MSNKKYFQIAPPKDKVRAILKEVRSAAFPWDAFPVRIGGWFEAMAFSVNTRPEFLFMGALSSTSVLLGPDTSMEIRSRYKESCNLFSITLCEPGAGKSQAFALAVEEPMSILPEEVRNCLVHEYTRKGLLEHISSRGGRVLLAHSEMTSFFDTLLRQQSEGAGERQLFCRLYDARTSLISTCHGKNQDKRHEVSQSCVVIGGFAQPEPYLTDFLPLATCNDGFLDRVLVCAVQPRLLQEDEVEQWNTKLDTFEITSFDCKIPVFIVSINMICDQLFINFAFLCLILLDFHFLTGRVAWAVGFE